VAGGAEDDEALKILGLADRVRAEAGRGRHRGSGCLPTAGDQRGDLLRLEEKYAHLGASELRELRQLREENAKLKHLVADLTLDKHIMAEIIRKKA
jgi:putative transposase